MLWICIENILLRAHFFTHKEQIDIAILSKNFINNPTECHKITAIILIRVNLKPFYIFIKKFYKYVNFRENFTVQKFSQKMLLATNIGINHISQNSLRVFSVQRSRKQGSGGKVVSLIFLKNVWFSRSFSEFSTIQTTTLKQICVCLILSMFSLPINSYTAAGFSH